MQLVGGDCFLLLDSAMVFRFEIGDDCRLPLIHFGWFLIGLFLFVECDDILSDQFVSFAVSLAQADFLENERHLGISRVFPMGGQKLFYCISSGPSEFRPLLPLLLEGELAQQFQTDLIFHYLTEKFL